MLDTSHQIIMGGEISDSTPQWNRIGNAARVERLKLYIPLKGQASIELDNTVKALTHPFVYLFNGTKLKSYTCEKRFQHAWIHFMPASLKLRHMLFKHFTYAQWEFAQLPGSPKLLESLQDLTAQREILNQNKNVDAFVPWAVHLADEVVELEIQSFLTGLLSAILQEQNITLSAQEQLTLEKLLPAIDFMERLYRKNPPLETIAAEVSMAPSYFHRLFVKHFNLTPHEFMLKRRLADARQLLLNTQQSVKQIAQTCGYDNRYYFAKVFKQAHHITPTQFRKNASPKST